MKWFVTATVISLSISATANAQATDQTLNLNAVDLNAPSLISTVGDATAIGSGVSVKKDRSLLTESASSDQALRTISKASKPLPPSYTPASASTYNYDYGNSSLGEASLGGHGHVGGYHGGCAAGCCDPRPNCAFKLWQNFCGQLHRPHICRESCVSECAPVESSDCGCADTNCASDCAVETSCEPACCGSVFRVGRPMLLDMIFTPRGGCGCQTCTDHCTTCQPACGGCVKAPCHSCSPYGRCAGPGLFHDALFGWVHDLQTLRDSLWVHFHDCEYAYGGCGCGGYGFAPACGGCNGSYIDSHEPASSQDASSINPPEAPKDDAQAVPPTPPQEPAAEKAASRGMINFGLFPLFGLKR